MAINYTEKIETKKAASDIVGVGANYRIEYTVRNPVGKPINSITASISQVTTEGEGEQATEKLTRVGNAAVDVDNNRNYFAIERHAEVSADNQAIVVTKYFEDVKSILTV